MPCVPQGRAVSQQPGPGAGAGARNAGAQTCRQAVARCDWNGPTLSSPDASLCFVPCALPAFALPMGAVSKGAPRIAVYVAPCLTLPPVFLAGHRRAPPMAAAVALAGAAGPRVGPLVAAAAVVLLAGVIQAVRVKAAQVRAVEEAKAGVQLGQGMLRHRGRAREQVLAAGARAWPASRGPGQGSSSSDNSSSPLTAAVRGTCLHPSGQW